MRVLYLIVVVGLVIMWSAVDWTLIDNTALAQGLSNDPRIDVLDNCDPVTFTPAGCALGPNKGDVTTVDFGALLFSPLVVTTVGHPSWRNEPSYISIHRGQNVLVTNRGGRGHTFTEVAAFGGGFVPPLNGVGVPGKVPLTPALACAPPPGTTILAP